MNKPPFHRAFLLGLTDLWVAWPNGGNGGCADAVIE
jgi:hypothetical protein